MADQQTTDGKHPSPDSKLSGDGRPACAGQEPSQSASDVPEDRQETVISKSPPLLDAGRHPATPTELGTLLEGEELGHFRLVEFVGGGGMGAVFRAEDMMLGRTVAVKILSGDHTDEEVLRRFKNEAQSAARLDHDNIARVHYVGEDKGYNYIVFEFVEGHNIRDLVIQKGPLSLEETIGYTLQVAEALEHAFRRDVVHRDIKPSNVLITHDAHVKLVDMGLARLHQVETPETDLTASGVTLGTFDYISPEQARDPRAADVRSDLYSLGCTFYFMLTGRPPFPEGTVLQKLLSHSSDERPDPRLYRPDLPEEVTVIVNKMLATHSQHRYQEPNELIGELLLLADQLGLHNATRGGTVWISNRGSKPTVVQRVTPVLIPIAALVVLVFALDHFWPTPSDEQVRRESPDLKAAMPSAADDGDETDRVRPAGGSKQDTDSHKSDDPPRVVEDSASDAVEPNTLEAPLVVDDKSSQLDKLLNLPRESSAIGPVPLSAGIDASKQGKQLALRVADSAEQLDAPDNLASATPPTGPTGPPARLIVGDADISPSAGDRIVDSLAAACELAKEHPELDEIELWFDGPRIEEPFEFAGGSLTIRAGSKDGDLKYQPVIVFRPKERGVDANGRMIRVVGGVLSWENVHFLLTLPNEASGWWSLFHLDQVESLRMRRCTMTIDNADFDGTRRQGDVSFVELAQRPKADGMRMPTEGGDMMAITPSIMLNHCAARGQADLIRAERASPLRLKWVQGLFITSDCLLRTGGATLPPTADDRIGIDLQHVTTFLGSGLCAMKPNQNDPNLLSLEITCSDSILLTDSFTALVEHTDVDDVGEVERSKLKFTGMRNCYPNTDLNRSKICWRIQSQADGQSTKVYDLSEDDGIEMWWSERSQSSSLENKIKQNVVWRRLPSENYPIHLRDASDYALNEEDATNDAVRSADDLSNAGFSKQLPEFPRVDLSQLAPPEPASAATTPE